MPFLKSVFLSTALALAAILAAGPASTNALAVSGSGGHAARNVGVTPAHQELAKRHRNTHKNRKRCVASNAPPAPPAAPPAPSPNVPSGPPPPTTYNGVGKVGLAWGPDVPSDYIINAVTPSTGYVYNWSAWAPNVNLGSAKFCPMFWGVKDNIPADFERLIRYGDVNYGVALAMNEVNQDGQARLDPGYGAQLWRQYLLPLRWEKGYRIGAPSTTSAPDGIPWIQGWLGQLGDNEKPDFLTIHWYGIGAQTMINYLQEFHAAFPGYKVWVTEFACNDFSYQSDCGDYNGFMDQVTGWMDSQDWIEAYFAFGFVNDSHGVDLRNQLIDPWTGQLKDLAHHYVH